MDPIRPVIEDNIDGARHYIDQIVNVKTLSPPAPTRTFPRAHSRLVEVINGVYVKHDQSLSGDDALMEARVGLFLPQNNSFKRRDMVLLRSEVSWVKKDGAERKVAIGR